MHEQNKFDLSDYQPNKFGYYDCPAHQCLARYFSLSKLCRHLSDDHEACTFYCSKDKVEENDID